MNALRAAAFGLPFVPVRNLKGTDILKFHPEFKQMESPYTGETVTLIPPLIPDVAVIHTQYADRMGHVKIYPPFVADTLFADASKKVIVTCERLVSTEEIKELTPNVPYFEVTAVVEVPCGAHPTSCYPFYAYDREHISYYMKSSGKGIDDFRKGYLKKYVLDLKSWQQYLDLVGGKEKFKRLESWNESVEKWEDIYNYG